ncbi:hypothetical protein SAMN05661012_06293 [Chitinophaga sancti]|uniref:Uncharacterized protein n=1 Tax=Chitinophaga sancti TaxID=1004 RepID=A0A1K1SWK4_9BACT|nr:hypothetical protein SAMN05661012_06293 [Chitinophaga sancti]
MAFGQISLSISNDTTLPFPKAYPAPGKNMLSPKMKAYFYRGAFQLKINNLLSARLKTAFSTP